MSFRVIFILKLSSIVYCFDKSNFEYKNSFNHKNDNCKLSEPLLEDDKQLMLKVKSCRFFQIQLTDCNVIINFRNVVVKSSLIHVFNFFFYLISMTYIQMKMSNLKATFLTDPHISDNPQFLNHNKTFCYQQSHNPNKNYSIKLFIQSFLRNLKYPFFSKKTLSINYICAN